MDDEPALVFATAQDMAEWVAGHKGTGGLWLRVPMKGSGHAGIGYAEALDVALTLGWIDGQRKGDDGSGYWRQRFVPRRPRSRWSQVNREHVERLTAQGRMTAGGQAQVDAAKADGRWDAAYAPQSRIEVPPTLEDALDRHPGARAALDGLDSRNRFAVLHRAGSPTTEKGRLAAAERLAAMLARGERPYP